MEGSGRALSGVGGTLMSSALARGHRFPGFEQPPDLAHQPIELHRLGVELLASGRKRLLALACKRMG
jgi:hypothetical protein